MTRLTIPKFKSLIIKGMHPDLVLETVFKQYKGTIHDTPYWKNQIKRHIKHYIITKNKSVQKSKKRDAGKRKSVKRKSVRK